MEVAYGFIPVELGLVLQHTISESFGLTGDGYIDEAMLPPSDSEESEKEESDSEESEKGEGEPPDNYCAGDSVGDTSRYVFSWGGVTWQKLLGAQPFAPKIPGRIVGFLASGLKVKLSLSVNRMDRQTWLGVLQYHLLLACTTREAAVHSSSSVLSLC